MNSLFKIFAEETDTPAGGPYLPHADDAPGGINTVGNTETNLEGNIINILNGIVGALAIVAVIVIIIGGIGYMTSSGDAAKVKKAKDTILYGIIGLIICVLAFAIVNFVIVNIIA